MNQRMKKTEERKVTKRHKNKKNRRKKQKQKKSRKTSLREDIISGQECPQRMKNYKCKNTAYKEISAHLHFLHGIVLFIAFYS